MLYLGVKSHGRANSARSLWRLAGRGGESGGESAHRVADVRGTVVAELQAASGLGYTVIVPDTHRHTGHLSVMAAHIHSKCITMCEV